MRGDFNNSLLFKNNIPLFPYCFLEIFVGGQGLDGGRQSCDRGDALVPPPGKTLICSLATMRKKKRRPTCLYISD